STPSPMKLTDKVAVITGAARGIGREIALRFASEGARVVITDLDEPAALAVADEIIKAGGAALGVKVDVSALSSVEAMVKTVLDRFDRLDVIVNTAGIGSNCPVLDMTLEECERNLRINLTGVFLCAQ